MAENSKKGVWYEAAFYTIAGTLPQAFNYLLLPLYLKRLTPEQYGILGYVNAVVWFVSITNTLSINSFFMRKYYESNDKRRFTGSIFYFLLAANTGLILLEGVCIYFAFRWFGVTVKFSPYMLLGLAEVYFNGFSIIPLRFFRLESLLGKYLGYNVSVLGLKHGLALLFIVGLGFSAEGFLMGGAISAGVLALYFIITAPSFAERVMDRETIRESLRFSLPLLPGAYATVALMMADRLILEKCVAMSELGIYTLGWSMASVLNIVVNSMLIVVEPRVYRISARKNSKKEYQELLDQYMFAIFALVAIFIVFIDDVTGIVFPPAYSRAGNIAMVISASTLFYGIQNIAGLQFLLHHNVFKQSSVTMFAAMINIILNAVLIPVYGIYAAAVVAMISYFVGMVVAAVFAERLSPGMVVRKKEYVVSAVFIAVVALSRIVSSNIQFAGGIKALLVVLFLYYCMRQYPIFSRRFNSTVEEDPQQAGVGR